MIECLSVESGEKLFYTRASFSSKAVEETKCILSTPYRNIMSKSNRSELEKFNDELDTYRSIAERNRHRLDEEPLLDKQLSFWFESTRFLISELEIWNQLGNNEKYEETVVKTQKVLDRVHALIIRFIEEL